MLHTIFEKFIDNCNLLRIVQETRQNLSKRARNVEMLRADSISRVLNEQTEILAWQLSYCGFCHYHSMTKSAIT